MNTVVRICVISKQRGDSIILLQLYVIGRSTTFALSCFITSNYVVKIVQMIASKSIDDWLAEKLTGEMAVVEGVYTAVFIKTA